MFPTAYDRCKVAWVTRCLPETLPTEKELLMINIIFDVDGTLVDSYALDAEHFCQAVAEVLGQADIREDWADYTHVSDAGILAEVLQDNQIEPNQELEDAVRERFGELVSNALLTQPCQPLPGAHDAMRYLQDRHSGAVGVATGGWSHTARAKLDAAGFEPDHWTLASSDDHAERTVIMKTCLERLSNPAARTVYFGDGVWDMNACADLDWGFVGVGARLKGVTPVWIEDYASCDLDQILAHATQTR